MPPENRAAGGMLIVAEYFDREDDRFIDALRQVYNAPPLAGFVDRWKQDPRPWAKRQVLAYLQHPLNVPGHHVVVKRLFKQAEARRDDEQMGAFMAAFDRLIRRERKKRRRYEWIRETRQTLSHETEYLANPRDALLPPLPRKARDPRTGKEITVPPPSQHYFKHLRMFSGKTRRYVQRRAWRYFRRMGFQRGKDYVAAVTAALLRYLDDDLAKPENLLDSWGLMHACFGKHPAIEFTPRAVKVKEGRTLAELTAAPYFEPLWAASEAEKPLWKLLLEAPSRTVRLWSRQLLERHHGASLQTVSIETLKMLLNHDDAELQQFGATLLARMQGVDRWPVTTWLELLDLRDPTALAIICEELGKRVSAERLDVAQTLELATARATPVARIGLQFLSSRKWDLADDRRRLTTLGNARCDAVAADLAKFGLGVVGVPDRFERDVVVALFDSLLEPMRAATAVWFASSATAQDDAVLWSRIIETPFDDVRLPIVDLLQRRASRPRIDGRCDLSGVWSAVLLGVHRGGRQKLKAVEQLIDAMIDEAGDSGELMTILAVAIRSIRGPEQRAGLAGLARLIDRKPEYADAAQRAMPELTLIQ